VSGRKGVGLPWLPARRRWLPPARRRLAPLLTAVAFAMAHPPLSFVPVLGLGLAAGELTLACGGLLPGILAHAAHNLVVVLAAR
jgi:membrane protease YdiL (CAAX protease family)